MLAVSGFCALIYESIWSPYLRNCLGHAAHERSVVLVIFVGGLAIGAWLAGRYTARAWAIRLTRIAERSLAEPT
ncbi:MAG: hypothetical protein WKF61_04925 [Luteimonas sp.]